MPRVTQALGFQMPSEIYTAIIGVASALFGTTCGGLLTYFTNRNIKIKEWQLSVLTDEINERKNLYSEFLAEASRLAVMSFSKKYSDLNEFQILNTKEAHIELIGAEKVVKEATAIVDHILSLHTENQKEPERNFFEIKTSFIKEVKEELHRLKKS